ncbi:DUF1345 domain-containing protein [Hafnia alvei]|uniref:DUF1345 domain-containing protein n=1 Tax=Hafnia alvei TaxID=569 RepID=UPI000DFF75F2|nr:DUF1345 domain-containing protein [Hafnia alvei]STQ68499.1 Predicted membrane protein [Hafnia alvei]
MSFISIKHYLQVRPRLLFAILAGFLTYLFLPTHLTLTHRLLISWNIAAWFYLFLVWALMMFSGKKRIAEIARAQDESASQVLFLICMTCLVSISVIFLELGTLKNLSGMGKTMHLALTGSTLFVSWALLPTAFTMHYAHLFYRYSNASEKVLIFPGNTEEPEYWDFLYYSFTIAVACQTADVETGTTNIRRFTLLQSVLSFLFNLAILGLSVNIAAGLIS